ncbi:hypothetical protein KUTeg_007193 [Tegillarca granosa]|uniref:Glucose-methanol-choline oxidoreductase N-terminal domain-containing protein n=1 Tax=Tegillarca granosa TaxID=220873 RepID=A0ABQ9FH65_TEGGR|nr:hypothetical protein KUTeg_007193 [Tegillarca granosa]
MRGIICKYFTYLSRSFFIPVGAGSAGAVIANRLSEDDKLSVILLEAGGVETDNELIDIPAAAMLLQKSEKDWDYYTQPQKYSSFALKNKLNFYLCIFTQQSFWPRGKLLGGSSNLNLMVYIRGSRHDYDEWESDGCTGWGYKDVLPYFLKSEDIKIDEFKDSVYHSKGGPLSVSYSAVAPISELFIKAGQELGYKVVDCNGEDQVGFCRIQSTIKMEEDTALSFFIPVGAGSAGAVIANRLSEDDKLSVILLEAGGVETDNELIDIPAAAMLLQKSEKDWDYYTQPQKYSSFALKNKLNFYLCIFTQQSFWPRGKLLGGSSNLNLMVYIRGSRHDYDEWESDGCTGWGYKDVLPYFLKSEDIKIDEFKDSVYHSKGGPLSVSYSAVAPISELFIKAGQELGYKVVDCNGEDQVENKRAVGVEIIKNGRKKIIRANKEVILSAGAINSPQILMLSGIGPRKHLEDLGIQVVADLPVGKNLQDHLLIQLGHFINSSVSLTAEKMESLLSIAKFFMFGSGYLTTSVIEGTAFFDTDPETKYADIQFHLFNLFGEKFQSNTINAFSILPTLLHPKSKGTITLQTKDPFDPPLIDPHYLEHPDDVRSFIKGIRIYEKLIQTPVFKKLDVSMEKTVYKEFCKEHKFRSDEFWECLVRQFATTVYHPTTTCRMGPDGDPTAVVDPNLRVRDVSGLRVADASVMRNVPSGNTNAPAIMIGEKAADLIRGIDSVKDLREKLKRTITLQTKDPFDPPLIDPHNLEHPDDVLTFIKGKTSVFKKIDVSMEKTVYKEFCKEHKFRSDEFWEVKGISGLRVAYASVMRNVPSGNTNAPAIIIGEKAADLIRGIDSVTDLRKKLKNHIK